MADQTSTNGYGGNGQTFNPTVVDVNSAFTSGNNQPFSASNTESGATAQVHVAQPERDTGGYKGAHPIAAIFHVAFKAGALLTFILGGIFSSNYVLIFVLTVLFCAADFWTTKNVSGRILVALRWWNLVNEDGRTQWIYESSPDADNRVNAYDRWFFWVTLAGYCGAWLLMCFLNLVSLSRLPIAAIGFALGGANLFGYFKCSRNTKQEVANYVLSQAAQNETVRQTIVSSVIPK